MILNRLYLAISIGWYLKTLHTNAHLEHFMPKSLFGLIYSEPILLIRVT